MWKMGNFLRGLLFGLGLGALVAPMRGQEMRRLLTDRFQELRGYIPEKTQINQYTQQVSEKATQTASTLKDYAQQATAQVQSTASNLGDLAQQATAQVKDTATNLGGIAQQAGSSTKDTASSLGNIAQQAGSDAKSTVSDVAQQATAKVQDTASTVANAAQQTAAKVQDTASTVTNAAQQAASQAKDTASTFAQQATAKVQDTASTVTNAAQQATSQAKDTVSNVAQQTTSQAKDTASNLVDTTQKAASNVKDTSKSAVNSVTQAANQTQQNVQSSTTSPVTASATGTPALGDSLSTIPGIEPEIQGKLEANGVNTISELLVQTGSKEERGDLSQKAAVSTHMLKTLADRADLMRLQGVTSDIAVMLEEAGVNGCRDLRRRNPEHLYTTLTEAQRSGDIATRTVPGIDQITQWIAEAMAVTSSQE